MFKVEINKEIKDSNTCIAETSVETWEIYYTLEYMAREGYRDNYLTNHTNQELPEGLAFINEEYIDPYKSVVYIKNVIPIAVKLVNGAEDAVILPLSEDEYWTLYERYHKDDEATIEMKKELFSEIEKEKEHQKRLQRRKNYKMPRKAFSMVDYL